MGSLPGCFNSFDSGERRALAKFGYPGFEICPRAFRVSFHSAVRQVAHPAGQPQRHSRILSKKAKSNALDATLDEEMNGGLWSGTHYLMIASFPEVSLP